MNGSTSRRRNRGRRRAGALMTMEMTVANLRVLLWIGTGDAWSSTGTQLSSFLCRGQPGS